MIKSTEIKRIILIGNRSFIQQNLYFFFKKKYKVVKIKFENVKKSLFFDNDVIINCSQDKRFFSKKYNKLYDRNYLIARLLGNKNINFVLLSSRSVYSPKFSLKENSNLSLTNRYGINCFKSEQNCKKLIKKLTILRISNVVGLEYGKKKRPSLMSIMINGIKKKRIVFDMNFYWYKDLIPVNILSQYIYKIITLKYFGIINVGSGFKLRVKDFIKYLSLNKKIKIKVIKIKTKTDDYSYNITKLKKLTKLYYSKEKIIGEYKKLGLQLKKIKC